MEFAGAVAVEPEPAAVDIIEAALIRRIEPDEDAAGVEVTTEEAEDDDETDEAADDLTIDASLALAFRLLLLLLWLLVALAPSC